jgi:hypothetical protein
MKERITVMSIEGEGFLLTKNEYLRAIRRFERDFDFKKQVELVRRSDIRDKAKLTICNGQFRRRLPL